MSERSVSAPALTVAIQTDKSTIAYGEIGRRVEHLGFDGLTAFADLGYQPPLPALLAAAAGTRTIRLGVACWNPTLLHPVELAGQYASLYDASGGRAYLGLTSGSWLDRIGLSTSGGVLRLAESIEAIRHLLAGRRSAFEGRYFRIAEGFGLRYALPHQEFEPLLGVWGPRGAALAAKVAGEVKLGGCANPAMVRQMRSWLTAGSAAAGRRRSVGVVAGAVTVVDRNRRAARRRARTEVAMYLEVVAPLDRTAAVPPDLLAGLRARLADGDHERAGRLIPDDILDLFCFAGTPDDIVGQVVALAGAGATRIEFGTPHGLTDLEGIDLLGTAVLPAARSALAVADTTAAQTTAARTTAAQMEGRV